jgi:hypothetical protein
MDPTLISKQEAGAQVEKDMLDFLMQFEPASGLTIGDAKTIARSARSFAFAAFLETK